MQVHVYADRASSAVVVVSVSPAHCVHNIHTQHSCCVCRSDGMHLARMCLTRSSKMRTHFVLEFSRFPNVALGKQQKHERRAQPMRSLTCACVCAHVWRPSVLFIYTIAHTNALICTCIFIYILYILGHICASHIHIHRCTPSCIKLCSLVVCGGYM